MPCQLKEFKRMPHELDSERPGEAYRNLHTGQPMDNCCPAHVPLTETFPVLQKHWFPWRLSIWGAVSQGTEGEAWHVWGTSSPSNSQTPPEKLYQCGSVGEGMFRSCVFWQGVLDNWQLCIRLLTTSIDVCPQSQADLIITFFAVHKWKHLSELKRRGWNDLRRIFGWPKEGFLWRFFICQLPTESFHEGWCSM